MNQNIDAKLMGKQLRQARIAQDISMAAFAEAAEMTARYLSDIERGCKVPKMDTLVKLVNLLGVSLDEVLGDSLKMGYRARSSALEERIAPLPAAQRIQIFEVIETLLRPHGLTPN